MAPHPSRLPTPPTLPPPSTVIPSGTSQSNLFDKQVNDAASFLNVTRGKVVRPSYLVKQKIGGLGFMAAVADGNCVLHVREIPHGMKFQVPKLLLAFPSPPLCSQPYKAEGLGWSLGRG